MNTLRSFLFEDVKTRRKDARSSARRGPGVGDGIRAPLQVLPAFRAGEGGDVVEESAVPAIPENSVKKLSKHD